MLAGKIHKVLFSVSAITYAVSVAFSIAVATVEKGYAAVSYTHLTLPTTPYV